MPELLEIEMYRRQADHTVGRTIAAVHTFDPNYVKGNPGGLAAILVGGVIEGTRRRGKLLLVDLRHGPTLGLRFGMTGRLLVDGAATIEKLEYSSGRDDPAWDRFALAFDDGGTLAMRDPRRLGSVELDPDEEALGPDAWTIGEVGLGEAIANSRSALKARLLDQKRLAGLGNLLTDEVLWRSALNPMRESQSLSPAELQTLHRQLRTALDELFARGGSHRGDLQDERHRDGHCPADGAPLRRDTIGGRTSYWCPQHQR